MDIAHIEDTARKLGDRLQPQIEDAKRRMKDVNGKVSSFIQENPGICLLGAIALGYAIARVARRQRS